MRGKRVSSIFSVLLFFVLLPSPSPAYFDHHEIPVESNAISYDDNLIQLDESQGYLWPEVVYSEWNINAVQQNTLKDFMRASNLSYSLKPLPENDSSFILPFLNRSSLYFSTGNYGLSFSFLLDAKKIMDSMEQKGFSLGKEQVKIFKSEPYEKAYACLQAGLLLYLKGDYQNARAMFAQSLELDRETMPDQEKMANLSEQEQSRYNLLGNDIRLAYYMLARTYQKLGDDGNVLVSLRNCSNYEDVPEKIRKQACEQFSQLAKTCDRRPPERNPYVSEDALATHNLVILVQMGFAPKKVIAGLEGQKDILAPRMYPEHKAVVYVDGRKIGETYPMFSMLHQASCMTRTMKDTAQVGKAAGKFALKLAASLVSSDLSTAIDNAWSVAADTRFWGTIPNEVHLVSTPTDPGLHDITVLFYDQLGNPLPHYEQTFYYVPVREAEETLLIVRSLANKNNALKDFFASKITKFDQKKNQVIFNPNDLLAEPNERLETYGMARKETESLINSKLPTGKLLTLFSIRFDTEEKKQQFLKNGLYKQINPMMMAYAAYGAYGAQNPGQVTVNYQNEVEINKVGTVRIDEIKKNLAYCSVQDGSLIPEEVYFVTTYDFPKPQLKMISNHQALGN